MTGVCVVCGKRTLRTASLGGYYGAIGVRYFLHKKCSKEGDLSA